MIHIMLQLDLFHFPPKIYHGKFAKSEHTYSPTIVFSKSYPIFQGMVSPKLFTYSTMFCFFSSTGFSHLGTFSYVFRDLTSN